MLLVSGLSNSSKMWLVTDTCWRTLQAQHLHLKRDTLVTAALGHSHCGTEDTKATGHLRIPSHQGTSLVLASSDISL